MSDGNVTMGVGSGGGKAFVTGDYDSIKVLQAKLLELEELRRFASTVASQGDDNPSMIKGILGSSIYAEAKRLTNMHK
jgi:hypothetical protein